jgi:hypothetical protein
MDLADRLKKQLERKREKQQALVAKQEVLKMRASLAWDYLVSAIKKKASNTNSKVQENVLEVTDGDLSLDINFTGGDELQNTRVSFNSEEKLVEVSVSGSISERIPLEVADDKNVCFRFARKNHTAEQIAEYVLNKASTLT